MGRLILLLTILLSLVPQVSVMAEWRIKFESKTVAVNQTGVTLGMDMYWDAEVSAVVVPVVVREITPGSFWAGILPCDTMRGIPRGVNWNWTNPGWANLIEEFRPGSNCESGANSYDGVSPDNFVVVALGIPDGISAEPAGRRVLTFEFDVSGQPGQFEFDTACFAFPSGGPNVSDLALMEARSPYTDHGPAGAGDCEFGKGIVTISTCSCPAQGDCNSDGKIDVSDLVYLISYTLYNYPAPQADPDCPAAHRGDWNADGRTNLVDIVSVARYLFRDPAMGPVDPCPY
jgi:hypothetical protein